MGIGIGTPTRLFDLVDSGMNCALSNPRRDTYTNDEMQAN